MLAANSSYKNAVATKTSAAAAVTSAQEDLTAAQSDLATAQQGPTSADIAKADAAVTAAQQALDAANAKLTELNAGPTASDVATAQENVKTAQGGLATAQAKLSELNAGPTQSDREKAQEDVVTAAAGLATAQAKLAAAEQRRRRATWRRPRTLSIRPPRRSPPHRQSATRLTPARRRKTSQLQRDQVQLAELSVAQAQKNLDGAKLIAPYDGTVAALNVAVGDTAGASSTTAPIILNTPNAVRLNLTVTESDLPSVKVGQSGIATFDALSGSVFPIVIDAVGTNPTTTQGVVTYVGAGALRDWSTGRHDRGGDSRCGRWPPISAWRRGGRQRNAAAAGTPVAGATPSAGGRVPGAKATAPAGIPVPGATPAGAGAGSAAVALLRREPLPLPALARRKPPQLPRRSRSPA